MPETLSLGLVLTTVSKLQSWQSPPVALAPLPVALALAMALHCCLAVVVVAVVAVVELVVCETLVVVVRQHGPRCLLLHSTSSVQCASFDSVACMP